MQYEPIGKHLSIASRKHRSVLTTLLRKTGMDLGSGQFPLLIALYKQDGQNQQALCRAFDIDKGAVARGVEKLVRSGLLVKVTDPKDNRRSLLKLTPKARELRPIFYSILERVDAKMKADLTEEEVAAFFRIMGKIEHALQQALQYTLQPATQESDYGNE